MQPVSVSVRRARTVASPAPWRWILGALLCIAAVLPAPAAAQLTDPATALRDYVQAPDAAYSYTLVNTVP